MRAPINPHLMLPGYRKVTTQKLNKAYVALNGKRILRKLDPVTGYGTILFKRAAEAYGYAIKVHSRWLRKYDLFIDNIIKEADHDN